MLKSNKAFLYTLCQLYAWSMATATQFCAKIKPKIYRANDSTSVLLLLGYAICVQLFEFGLSQVL